MSVTPTSPSNRDGSASPAAERRFVLRGVPWWTYVALRDALDDEHSGIRMSYLDGDLELMTPSELHEDTKTILARLLETWATELDVDLRGFGNATYRDEAKRGGLEPDECYKLGGAKKAVPDIAIEVIVSTPDVDKLEIYARLGVTEVWIWQSGSLAIHRLDADRGVYGVKERSGVLADLDVAELVSFVRLGESHTALARQYREALRRGAASANAPDV